MFLKITCRLQVSHGSLHTGLCRWTFLAISYGTSYYQACSGDVVIPEHAGEPQHGMPNRHLQTKGRFVGVCSEVVGAGNEEINFFTQPWQSHQQQQPESAVLLSFFSESLGETVIDYYASVSLTDATAHTLYEAVRNLLERDKIPAANLVSVLTDSVNYMTGNHSGLQKLLRDNFAPYLLDIGGDVCHRVHNFCKKFSSYFDQKVEHMFDDINMDHKFNQDLRAYIKRAVFHVECQVWGPKGEGECLVYWWVSTECGMPWHCCTSYGSPKHSDTYIRT